MEKLCAILVDDEEPGRKNLALLLTSYCPEVQVAGTASSALEARELVENCHPDLVFLDINMPQMNGFEFLDMFESRDFYVVFVTAHDEFGIQAVKASAVDYVLKPISISELRKAVRKVQQLKEQDGLKTERLPSAQAGKLAVSHLNGFDVIEMEDIVRLEADDNYTTIFTRNQGKIVVSRTIGDFEGKLDSETFLRIHRTHIINLKHLRKYSRKDGGIAFMSDGSELNIAKRRHSEFMERIGQFLTTLK